MFSKLRQKLGIHPRLWIDSLLTYPRFLGQIKPRLLGASEDETQARLMSMQRCWDRSILKAPLGKRLLVISPHPDDESIGCGGLLLAHRGCAEVHVVTLFNGEGGGQLKDGPWQNTPVYKERLVEQRKRELSTAAAQLGLASTHALDLPDGYSDPKKEDVRRLREIVMKIRPDVVLIPWYLDTLPDHRMANLLYASACPDSECVTLGFEVWTLCPVNAVFELGELLGEKQRLVSHYESQIATVDYATYVKALAEVRGFIHGMGVRRNSPSEAFFALSNRDYCELVRNVYGEPGSLTESAQRIFGVAPMKKVGNAK